LATVVGKKKRLLWLVNMISVFYIDISKKNNNARAGAQDELNPLPKFAHTLAI
jgi:hypothetical protein